MLMLSAGALKTGPSCTFSEAVTVREGKKVMSKYLKYLRYSFLGTSCQANGKIKSS